MNSSRLEFRFSSHIHYSPFSVPLSHPLTVNRSSIVSSVIALHRAKLPSRATPTLHVMPLLACKNWCRHSLPGWYFFSPRDQKYPNGSWPNRAAGTGYWKATGADKPLRKPRTLGIKKALVFYAGKAPKGAKTNWIMHEYRLANVDRSTGKRNNLRLDDWVLCRIYKEEVQMYKRRQVGASGVICLGPKDVKLLSHEIPTKKLSGKESSNLPKICWELDSASLTPRLIIAS